MSLWTFRLWSTEGLSLWSTSCRQGKKDKQQLSRGEAVIKLQTGTLQRKCIPVCSGRSVSANKAASHQTTHVWQVRLGSCNFISALTMFIWSRGSNGYLSSGHQKNCDPCHTTSFKCPGDLPAKQQQPVHLCPPGFTSICITGGWREWESQGMGNHRHSPSCDPPYFTKESDINPSVWGRVQPRPQHFKFKVLIQGCI